MKLLNVVFVVTLSSIAFNSFGMNAIKNYFTSQATKDLLRASQELNINGVRAALAAGADVNGQGRYYYRYYQMTPLICAVDAVKTLTTDDHNIFQQRQRVCMDILTALIAAHANVNAQDTYGRTALMIASSRGLIGPVKILIAAGADVDLKTKKEKMTALLYATKFGTAPHSGAPAAQQRIIEALIGAGANVNAQDEEGNTPLMIEVQPCYDGVCWNSIAIIKAFLVAGADTSLRNKKGQTALDRIDDSKFNVLYILNKKQLLKAVNDLDYPAVKEALNLWPISVDASDEYGNTVLHLAAGTTKKNTYDVDSFAAAVSITKELLERGAEIRKNKNRETPIDVALVLPDSPIVKVYKNYAKRRSDIKKALEEARTQHKAEVAQDYKEMKKAYPGDW